MMEMALKAIVRIAIRIKQEEMLKEQNRSYYNKPTLRLKTQH